MVTTVLVPILSIITLMILLMMTAIAIIIMKYLFLNLNFNYNSSDTENTNIITNIINNSRLILLIVPELVKGFCLVSRSVPRAEHLTWSVMELE